MTQAEFTIALNDYTRTGNFSLAQLQSVMADSKILFLTEDTSGYSNESLDQDIEHNNTANTAIVSVSAFSVRLQKYAKAHNDPVTEAACITLRDDMEVITINSSLIMTYLRERVFNIANATDIIAYVADTRTQVQTYRTV